MRNLDTEAQASLQADVETVLAQIEKRTLLMELLTSVGSTKPEELYTVQGNTLIIMSLFSAMVILNSLTQEEEEEND